MNAPAIFTASYSMSACDRVLAAVRWCYRKTGRSPGFRDIEQMAVVNPGRIGRYLDQLEQEGFLTRSRGEGRSIRMIDRLANFSDDELIAACHARNMTIILPPVAAMPIGESYPLDMRETDCLADLIDKLGDIPGTIDGDQRHGQEEQHQD